MVGRKSILVGMLTSGIVIANAARASADTSPTSPLAESVQTIVCAGKGIDPTGVLDSTDALRAKIALATVGKTVFLPAGQYLISDRLILAKPGVNFEGAGGGVSQLRPTFRNLAGAYLQLNASDISVRGIGIVAAASVNNGTNGFVIGGIAIGDTTGPLGSVRRVHVQDCYIADVSGHGIICQPEAMDCVISGNIIERVGATAAGTQLGDGDGHGISVVGTGHVVSGNIVRDGLMRGIEVFGTERVLTNDCTITGNSLSGNAQDAITVKDVTRSTITGNTCSKNGRFGIYLGMASLVGIYDVTIAGNSVVLNGNDGIHIEGNASRIAVTGNTVEKNGGSGVNVISSRGVDPSNITILGCTIYRNYQYGVFVNSGTQIAITGNTVVENGYKQASNRYSGIWVIGVSAHVSITGNTCFDGQEVKTQQYGIAVSGSGPANYVVVIGNECSGNGDLKEDIYVVPTSNNKLAWCGGRYTGRGTA